MRFSLAFLLFFVSSSVFGQIYNPVKWSTSYNHVGGDEFELVFTAKIQDGWTIYSQYLESDDGPVATSFNFDDAGKHYDTVGKTVEADMNKKEGYDKLFEMNVIKYAKKAVFTQKIKVKDISKPIIGYLNYMTCDDTKCLPPTDEDFEFKLEKPAADPGTSSGAVDPVKEEVKKVEKVVENTTNKAKETANTAAIAAAKAKEELAKKKRIAEAKNKLAEASKSKEKEKSTPKKKAEKEEEKKAEKADEPEKSGILQPVKWTSNLKSLGNGEYQLNYIATIQKGWKIYSQHLKGDDGPVPTGFFYDEGAYSKIGETSEKGSKKSEGFDKVFEMNLITFKKDATFSQKIKVTDPTKPIKGYFEFMTCDDSRCLPPEEVDFVFVPKDNLTLLGSKAVDFLGGGDGGSQPAADVVSINNAGAIQSPLFKNFALLNPGKPIKNCGDVVAEETKDQSWLSIFILGFFGGFLALLTPCVFPMIPLTVSYFTKGSENKKQGLINAFMYGFFILMVYVVLSVPFHLMDSINPDILNDISTNVWLNLGFFFIFLFFAFSFFGYYELTMPSSLTNRVSSAEGVGGMIGIFFMALTLALVSFSCTGPILGSLLAGAMSSNGGAWQLTSGMAGFGLALALPFALFAAFPGWMNSLPKSGGWLNTVKVVLGFLELALALKFLSNADLVKHWGLLKIEPFLILWIIIFLAMGAYLFGKLRFPHDSPNQKISAVRGGLGALSILFAGYLATGFMYNEKSETFSPLGLLSGLAPPVGYSWIYPKECPNNLDCFKDFESGLAYAKEVNKPIMIDFTGHACVNCRKMEEHVWPKSQIHKYLKEDFVLISLYVDEKLELPESEQISVPKVSGEGNRKLRTTGNKWSYFQTKYFENNSQPYYVLMSPDGTLLNKPAAYTPDVDEYASFLECGLNAYQENFKTIGQK